MTTITMMILSRGSFETGNESSRSPVGKSFIGRASSKRIGPLALGFSQVYVWAFVLADTRWVNGGRYTYDGPDPYWRSAIDDALSPAGLDPGIGVMHYEWVQPMDRPPLELATYGGHFQKPAMRATQPQDLTEWLRTLRLSAEDLAI